MWSIFSGLGLRLGLLGPLWLGQGWATASRPARARASGPARARARAKARAWSSRSASGRASGCGQFLVDYGLVSLLELELC